MLTLLIFIVLAGHAAAAGFSDVKNHWAGEQITGWAESGLAAGYSDGTFKPEQNVSRLEFVLLANRAFDIKVQGITETGFTDVKKDSWYAADVAAAKRTGYISGFSDGTFRPNQIITRQEVAGILTRLLKITAVSEPATDSLGAFRDGGQIPEWSRGSIAAAVNTGLMRGMPDATFMPYKSLTRAEAVVSLDRAIKFSKQGVPAESVLQGKISYNGSPAGSTTISIFIAGSYKEIKKTQTDPGGNYQVKLEPGIYDVTASSGEAVGFKDSVNLTAGKTWELSLSLEDAAVINGTLVDKYGNAAEHAMLVFTTNPSFVCTTGSKGSFTAALLPDRNYIVRVFDPNHQDGEPYVLESKLIVGGTGKHHIDTLRAPFSVRNNSSGGSGHSGGGSGNDGDNGAVENLDLNIVKVKGNTVNDMGNMITAVVKGDLDKLHGIIRDLELPNAEDLVAEVINRLNIQIEGVKAFNCSFEDMNLDFIPDVFNVQISKRIIDSIEWGKDSEAKLRLSMNLPKYGDTLLYGSIKKGEGDSGEEEGHGGSGGYGGGNNGSVSEAVYGINVDVKRRMVNQDGKLPISIWGEEGVDVFAISNLKVEGTNPAKVIYQKEQGSNVMFALAGMGAIWDKVKSDHTVTLTMDYYGYPLSFEHPISIISSGKSSVLENVYSGRGSVTDSVYGTGYSVLDSVYGGGSLSVLGAVYSGLTGEWIIDDAIINDDSEMNTHYGNYGQGLEIVNVKGNIVNDMGNMITVVVGGQIEKLKDIVKKLTIEVEGEVIDISKCSFEDLDLDFIPEVLNVRINKGKIWGKVKEDGNITLTTILGDSPVSLTVPLTHGGGCAGDEGRGGGCGEDHGESGTDGGCGGSEGGGETGGGCGEDHQEGGSEGGCGGESGEESGGGCESGTGTGSGQEN